MRSQATRRQAGARQSGKSVGWVSPTGPRNARPDDRLRRNPPFQAIGKTLSSIAPGVILNTIAITGQQQEVRDGAQYRQDRRRGAGAALFDAARRQLGVEEFRLGRP